jgi:uncharacterized protein (UPF0333 family)
MLCKLIFITGYIISPPFILCNYIRYFYAFQYSGQKELITRKVKENVTIQSLKFSRKTDKIHHVAHIPV